MKANFKREVKRNKNKHNIMRERGKTGSTRDKRWAAGWEFSRPAQKPLLSRVKPPAGTKGPFIVLVLRSPTLMIFKVEKAHSMLPVETGRDKKQPKQYIIQVCQNLILRRHQNYFFSLYSYWK